MKIFNTFIGKAITSILSPRKVQTVSNNNLPIDNVLIVGIKGMLTPVNETDVLMLQKLPDGETLAIQTQLGYSTKNIANAINSNGLSNPEDILLGGILGTSKIVILQTSKITISNNKANIILNNESVKIKNSQCDLFPDIVTFLNALKDVKVLNPMSGNFDLPIDPTTQAAIQNLITKLESFN